MARNMVHLQYLHQLDPGDLPLKNTSISRAITMASLDYLQGEVWLILEMLHTLAEEIHNSAMRLQPFPYLFPGIRMDTVDKRLICGWKFEALLIIMAIISVRL